MTYFLGGHGLAASGGGGTTDTTARAVATNAQATADALRATDVASAVVDASTPGAETITITRTDGSTHGIDVSALAGGGTAAQTTFDNVAAALAGNPANVQGAIDAIDADIDALKTAATAQDALIAAKADSADLHDAVTLAAGSNPALSLTGQELNLTLPEPVDTLTEAEVTSTTGVDYTAEGVVSARRLDQWGQSRRVARIFADPGDFDYTALGYADRTAVFIRNPDPVNGKSVTYGGGGAVTLTVIPSNGQTQTITGQDIYNNIQPGEWAVLEKDGNTATLSIMSGERVVYFDDYADAALGAPSLVPFDGIAVIRDAGEIWARKTTVNSVAFPADGVPTADWFKIASNPDLGAVYPGNGVSPTLKRRNVYFSDETVGPDPVAEAGEWYDVLTLNKTIANFSPAGLPSHEFERFVAVEDPASLGDFYWSRQGQTESGGFTRHVFHANDRFQSMQFSLGDRRAAFESRQNRYSLSLEDLTAGNADFTLDPGNAPAGYTRLITTMAVGANYFFTIDWRVIGDEYEFIVEEAHGGRFNTYGRIFDLDLKFAATDPSKPNWEPNVTYALGDVVIGQAPTGVTETAGDWFVMQANSDRTNIATLDAAEWPNWNVTPLAPKLQNVTVETLADRPAPATLLSGSQVNVVADPDATNNGTYTAIGPVGDAATGYTEPSASSMDVVRFPGDSGAQLNGHENFYWSDETVGAQPAAALGQEFSTAVSSAASTDTEAVKDAATVTITHFRWVDNGGAIPVAIATESVTGGVSVLTYGSFHGKFTSTGTLTFTETPSTSLIAKQTDNQTFRLQGGYEYVIHGAFSKDDNVSHVVLFAFEDGVQVERSGTGGANHWKGGNSWTHRVAIPAGQTRDYTFQATNNGAVSNLTGSIDIEAQSSVDVGYVLDAQVADATNEYLKFVTASPFNDTFTPSASGAYVFKLTAGYSGGTNSGIDVGTTLNGTEIYDGVAANERVSQSPNGSDEAIQRQYEINLIAGTTYHIRHWGGGGSVNNTHTLNIRRKGALVASDLTTETIDVVAKLNEWTGSAGISNGALTTIDTAMDWSSAEYFEITIADGALSQIHKTYRGDVSQITGTTGNSLLCDRYDTQFLYVNNLNLATGVFQSQISNGSGWHVKKVTLYGSRTIQAII